MRLMKPSPGEAYDRLTILHLKIKHCEAKQISWDQFSEEHTALANYMIANHHNVPTDLADEMTKINSRLWDLEDAQRALLKNYPPIEDNFSEWKAEDEFARNAVTIIQLNDARANTVQKINAACGVNAPEKLHDTN